MEYYNYSKAQLLENSKVKLNHLTTNDLIFQALAQEMITIIKDNQLKDEPTVFICPVGPVGHYPYFVEMVNQQNLSLKKVWFLNMDEYLDDEDQWIAIDHPLSFRGFMDRVVYSQIKPELVMPENQRLFPDPQNPGHLQKVIDQLGKVDACFGGIGINGHVAFNEPDTRLSPEEFLELPTRVLTIDPMTRAINAVGDLNGAIELMPHRCVTIGMKEIKQAQRLRLGVFRDWHRAVLRRTSCGNPTSEFPVTLLQDHSDFQLFASDFVLNLPE